MSIKEIPALVEKAKIMKSPKSSSRVVKPQIVGGPSRSEPIYENKNKSYYRPQFFRSEGPTHFSITT